MKSKQQSRSSTKIQDTPSTLVNGHPHWHSVQTLAMFFQAIDEATGGEAKVDMMGVTCTLEKNLCGTPACHAGWFGIFFDDVNDSGGKKKHFYNYAKDIADILGLKSKDELESWARLNQELWGNEFGYFMFSTRTAFKDYSLEAITLKDIADHWFAVSQRLYDLQVLGRTP